MLIFSLISISLHWCNEKGIEGIKLRLEHLSTTLASASLANSRKILTRQVKCGEYVKIRVFE